MCGIVGILHFANSGSVDRQTLDRMRDTLRHRGPDAEGSFIDETGTVGLGHRRLSIIDLSTGDQPMLDESGDLCIVFNGEIYNYRELREDLRNKGHRFLTRSDTEVILRMYAEEGERGMARLNGIFAFALYDRRTRSLLLARDRFGVKPLYYVVAGGALIFGSEMKALRKHPAVTSELDLGALNSFLTYRYNPSPQTLIKGIHKLEPGHMLLADQSGAMNVCPIPVERPATDLKVTEDEAAEEYARLLKAAIQRQMVSDVPVGLLLSGGIDSAVIGYHMREAAGGPVKTFTVGFHGEGEYNELADARATASLLGTEHFEISLSAQNYLEFFPRSFYYTEEPIAEPTIPALYYVSRLAAEQVKVVLTGQGADEPLAGYDRYIGEHYLSLFPGVMRHLPLEPLASALPRNERLKRAAYASRFGDSVDRFLALYTIFTPAMKERLLLPEIRRQMPDVDRGPVERLYALTGGLQGTLAKLLFMDARLSLPDNLLLFGDKMSMANSLEMRVPFLDLDLMLFLESLPSSMKLRGKTGKYLHKKVLRRWIPQEIIGRKKRGFATPMDPWLQGPLAESARRLVNAPDAALRKYFHVGAINEMIDKHIARRENFRRHIFALLCFELWHHIVLDGKNPEDVVLDVNHDA